MYDSKPAAGEYPRLFFTRSDLPAIREKLAHPDCRGTWERLLAACEQRLKPDAPPVYPRHIRSEHLAFAWLITGREEFAVRARELALAYLDHASWDPKNNHGCASLATGGATRTLGMTYDWLYDFLSPQDRAQIRNRIQEWGLQVVLHDFQTKHPATQWYTCNGINVINGPTLMASILFEEAMDTRAVFDACLHQTRQAIDSHCPDGGYPEGLLYWNYGTRHMLCGVEPLRRLKGIDLYHEPFLHNTAHYALHNILPWLTNCNNTADSSHLTHLWPPVAFLAAYHKQPEFQWIARRLITHDWGMDGESLEYSLYYLIAYDPSVPSAPPPDSQRNRFFSGLQMLSLRSDWSDDAVQATWLNGPANCHHNHLHLNSFTLSAFGERLLVECGQYDYSNGKDYRLDTIAHNSLLVNGQGQVITTDTSIFCRRLRAGQWATVYGVFENLREEADATIATGRVVNAYPGRLRTFDRTLAFVNREFIFIHDQIERAGDSPVDLSWIFHSGGGIETRDGSALFTAGHVRLQIIPLSRMALTQRIASDHSTRADPSTPITYLKLEASCPDNTGDFYALLIPYREENPPVATLTNSMVRNVIAEYETGYGIKPAREIESQSPGVIFSVNGRSWSYNPVSRKIMSS
ncbi:MAG: hypothetical protein A2498_09540 [Lentisphaerae bacterium RIFOXYC12_FULL_60_16]|nr:MAG: hypothetical protein A2498_09540 [Lentisphaerae bacterium RIFOXYC12_FULL_60_16]OGV86838.1 MAG: hypothetical protein A2340_14095 [Lentisphaerae bacterium RIFOXYB12_FULL_60_10]